MDEPIQVGDTVVWEHYEHKRRSTVLTQRSGTVVASVDGVATIDRGKYQRRVRVSVDRLTRLAPALRLRSGQAGVTQP